MNWIYRDGWMSGVIDGTRISAGPQLGFVPTLLGAAAIFAVLAASALLGRWLDRRSPPPVDHEWF